MTISTKPCALEIELLRDMNGEKTTITGWGSWMGDAVEFLRNKGWVSRVGGRYCINDAGRAYLASLDAA